MWFDRGTKVAAGGRTSLIIDPADGRIPWTPEGRQHYQRSRARYGKGPYYSVLDMDTGERCLTDGLPMVPTQGYNMNYHILQTPGYVAILHEMYHESRIIPIDGRPHLDSKIPQWLGDARGHWEGDTLVVETTNFADKSPLLVGGELAHIATDATPGRAIYPRRCGDDRLSIHDDRSDELHQTLDRVDSHDDESGRSRRHFRSDVRVRVSRRQLRRRKRPSWSACRRGSGRKSRQQRFSGGVTQMRTKLYVVVLGVVLALNVTTAPAPAHHAFAAEFDADKPILLDGTVTKMEWINPHAWIHIDVEKEDGTVESLDDRRRHPEHAFSARLQQKVVTTGDEDRRQRLSIQRRLTQRKRQGLDVSRWPQAFPWVLPEPAAPRDGTDPTEPKPKTKK